MARKFVSKNKKQYTMDMTPLIDVVFLLLIFFMVTTTFSKFTAMDINLPKSDTTVKSKLNEIRLVEVLLNSDKKLTIRTKTGDREATEGVSEKELVNRLTLILKENDTANISLVADEKLNYGYIIKIMSQIKEAKAEGISLKIENSM